VKRTDCKLDQKRKEGRKEEGKGRKELQLLLLLFHFFFVFFLIVAQLKFSWNQRALNYCCLCVIEELSTGAHGAVFVGVE